MRLPCGWVAGAFSGLTIGPVFTFPRMVAEFDIAAVPGADLRVLPDAGDPVALARCAGGLRTCAPHRGGQPDMERDAAPSRSARARGSVYARTLPHSALKDYQGCGRNRHDAPRRRDRGRDDGCGAAATAYR